MITERTLGGSGLPEVLPSAALRRLARDADRRGRTPVRVLALFDAKPLPVARFVDLRVGLPRR